MPEQTASSKPVKRRTWGRKLAIIAGSLLVLLVVLYFVATSAAFLKGVILPRVSKALHAEVTVADASISPFSQVVLRQLLVKTTGSEPLLKAEEVRLRYSLTRILGGNIKVDEVTVTAPTIQIVQNADGTSNLDPFLKQPAAPPKPSARPAKPPQLDVRNVSLKNVAVRAVRNLKDGERQTIELSDINIGLDQLKNGQSGKLTLAAVMQADRARGATRDTLQSKGSGAIDFTVGADLMPQIIKGKVTHEIVKAVGSFAEFAGHRAQLDCDITPTEVKAFALSFLQGDKLLGSLLIRGPLDLTRLEGRLSAELKSIDRQVLNLAGAARGWDFGSSTLNATNLIDLAQKGSVVSASGKLLGRQLGIRQNNKATPALDLDLDYQVTVNLNDQSALVQRLEFVGKQGPTELLRAALDRPMNLAWGGTQPGFKESALQLAVTKLNLSDWRLLLGDMPLAGIVDVQLNLLAQQDGKQLKTDLTAKVQDLSAQFGSTKVERATAQAQVAAHVADFKDVTLDKYSFELSQQNRSLLTAGGSGSYNVKNGELGVQTTLEASLPALLQIVSLPQLSVSAGALKFTGLYSQKSQQTNASGNVVLSDFSGRYGEYQLQGFQSTVDFDVELKENAAQVRRLGLAVRQGSASGGGFDLAGRWDLAKRAGEFNFNLVDFNQNALRPFLAPALAPNKLVTASLSGKGNASYNAQTESALKAELKFANLVVEDPEKKLPQSPLSADLQLDGSLRKELLTLRQLIVGLTPTARAKNQLQLQGKVDLAKTNAAPGELALRAESLDLTPYYDLFAGQSKPATQEPAPTPKTTPPPAAPRTEPAPVALPFQQFNVDAKVDRLFLREIAVSNLVTAVKINRGEVALKPFQLTLNGAPVAADAALNLGVKGWTYNLSLNADKVPLDPFVGSFMPDSRGQYQGLVLANAQIKGAGITDASIQKNLSGQFGFSVTNATIQLFANNKPPKNILMRLIWYPLNSIGLFLRINEITSSPLNAIVAQAQIGDGKVNLSRVSFQSQAFEAHTQGIVPLEVPLDHSPLNLPLEFSLSRSLAQKSGLMPANTPPDAAYAALPSFVTVKGTIAEPKSDFKELAIGGTLLKAGVGVAEKLGVNVGEKTSGVLRGVGNLLTGQGSASTNVADTNKAGTNTPPKRSLFDLVPKKK